MALLSNEAVSFLIAANGNTALAAVSASEHFGAPGSVSEADLLLAIAGDISSLAILGQQVRLLMIVQTLEAFRLTHAAYVAKLADMTPRDTAAAYSRIIQDISALTSGAPLKMPDPVDTLLNALPPQIRVSVEYFLRNPAAAASLPTPPVTTSGPAPSPTNPTQPQRPTGASPTTQGVLGAPGNRADTPPNDPTWDEVETGYEPSISEQLSGRIEGGE